jgi:hypothetical protein
MFQSKSIAASSRISAGAPANLVLEKYSPRHAEITGVGVEVGVGVGVAVGVDVGVDEGGPGVFVGGSAVDVGVNVGVEVDVGVGVAVRDALVISNRVDALSSVSEDRVTTSTRGIPAQGAPPGKVNEVIKLPSSVTVTAATGRGCGDSCVSEAGSTNTDTVSAGCQPSPATKMSAPGSAFSNESWMEGVGPSVGVVEVAGISVGITSPAVAESPIISTPTAAVTSNNRATNVGLLCRTLYHFLIEFRICTTFTTPLSVCAIHATNKPAIRTTSCGYNRMWAA